MNEKALFNESARVVSVYLNYHTASALYKVVNLNRFDLSGTAEERFNVRAERSRERE